MTTTHGRLDLPYLTHLARVFPEAPFVSISDNQREPLRELNWVATVYHGQPPETCTAGHQSARYLAFLGRMAPEKGPEAAIRLAAAAACRCASPPRCRATATSISANASSR